MAGHGDADGRVAEDLSGLAEQAVALVDGWLAEAAAAETPGERRRAGRLAGLLADPAGVRFAMGFVDRVIRAEDDRVAARQLADIAGRGGLPRFLSRLDRLLLRAGAALAPLAPGLVMGPARRRLRSLVGHLVVDADEAAMADHLSRRRSEGFALNVNLLGEAVLGRQEAQRRHAEAVRLLDQPHVDYVSVKVSSVVSQLNHWDFEGSLQRVKAALRSLFEHALAGDPPTFVNLDMEEYHDLELTKAAFMALLDEPPFRSLDAGIVLQAYLPDSFEALREIAAWAAERGARQAGQAGQASQAGDRPGGTVKVRLAKGANLAMERVDAAMHGWPQAPYATKAETDANYKRCLDWLMTPARMQSMHLGVASHNLYDLAFAKLLAQRRGVTNKVSFEMLEGMAPAQARLLRADDAGMLLYTPVVRPDDFDVAISYLFRRLEENATEENFIHRLFTLRPGEPDTVAEADRFRASVRDRWSVSAAPNRRQDRRNPPEPRLPGRGFVNACDTDPALAANRSWAAQALASPETTPTAALTRDPAVVDAAVAAARRGQQAWAQRSAEQRRETLYRAADELERNRGRLISAMAHEARKTLAQADPEVSEAVDFARYYGERALDLEAFEHARFEPLGVVVVASPWNFPVAIPAGGVFAALAAGNSVLAKPAPQTPRCAELIAECAWAAGVPADALGLLRVPDDDTGRRLIAHPDVDAVILTGAHETAELFRSWRPELAILAETSGKNAMVITPSADMDQAVADLVASAFGAAGQKCSAASLAILVGKAAESQRFGRQLVDAVTSLEVGPAHRLATTMGPVIEAPTPKLRRALTELAPGERWLVAPAELDEATWTPGVRQWVQPGSWFHLTECFGPVLGLMRAADLAEALRLQNATGYGLTGGIHSLDPAEVAWWLQRVEVGNAYVNRPTTGSIVGRQPFGGWKRSSVGPGAKAGGPNYVAQLGRWQPAEAGRDRDEAWLAAATADDEQAWQAEFGAEHDPAGLFCETNRFGYRPLGRIAVRDETGGAAGSAGGGIALRRFVAAAQRCGCEAVVSSAADESPEDFAQRLAGIDAERVRVIGETHPAIRAAAGELGIHVADAPVVRHGRIEMLHCLREQTVSVTAHRYGNLISA